MNPQLVGAAGVGFKGYPCPPTAALEHLIARHCRLAMPEIYPLARTVVNVGQQGQVNHALVVLDNAVEQGNIAFPDAIVLELLLQGLVGGLVLGKDDQP